MCPGCRGWWWSRVLPAAGVWAGDPESGCKQPAGGWSSSQQQGPIPRTSTRSDLDPPELRCKSGDHFLRWGGSERPRWGQSRWISTSPGRGWSEPGMAVQQSSLVSRSHFGSPSESGLTLRGKAERKTWLLGRMSQFYSLGQSHNMANIEGELGILAFWMSY